MKKDNSKTNGSEKTYAATKTSGNKKNNASTKTNGNKTTDSSTMLVDTTKTNDNLKTANNLRTSGKRNRSKKKTNNETELRSNIDTPYISDANQIKLINEKVHGEMKYTLMNDFLAKFCLQNDLYALKGLLAALLHMELDDITNIKVMNPYLPGDTVTDKDCILDIKLELNHVKYTNIEIQANAQSFFPERTLLYLARTYDNIKSGELYDEIKPCVQIGILAGDLFAVDDERYTGEFYSEYALMNVRNYKYFTSKFQIKMLSLKHIEEASEEEKNNPNGLYCWAKLFRATSWEELDMVAKMNERIESLIRTAKSASQDQAVAYECEAREKYYRTILTYDNMIRKKDQQLEQNAQQLERNAKQLEQKDQQLEQKDQQLEQNAKQLEQKDQQLEQNAKLLEQKDQEFQQERQRNIKNMLDMCQELGKTSDEAIIMLKDMYNLNDKQAEEYVLQNWNMHSNKL